MGFTKEWVKTRWNIARNYQRLYNEQFGEKIGVKEFYKNDNPLTSKYKRWKITYSLNYTNTEEDYSFFVPQETIVFLTSDSDGVKNTEIFVKDSIASIFKGKAYKWVKQHLEVKQEEIRGAEYENLKYYDMKNVLTIPSSNIIIEKKPPTFEVIKSKGLTTPKKVKNKYNLEVWF